MCLRTGRTPPASNPRGDKPGLGPIGAIADYRVGVANGHIEHLQAIDGYAEPVEIVGDQAGDGARRRGRFGAEGGDARRRGIASPMRRTQPCDAAALLVDEDRRIGSSDAVAQICDEATQLFGFDAVALK